VSRRAKVARYKSNLFRKIRILEKRGRRKEFAAARIRTTRCAKWHGAKDAVMKDCRSNRNDGTIRLRIKFQEEPEEEGCSEEKN
jgi:hypothetical protein